jgi:bacterioferritin
MQGFDNVKITAIDNKLLSAHPEIVDLLQKAYSSEHLAWLAYEHLKHMFVGHWRGDLYSHFSSHADEEEAHGEWIGEKLTALGEIPELDMAEIGRVAEFTGEDYATILDFIMTLENEAIVLYNKMIPLLQENAALRTQIENFATTEQEHFEDFEKFMRIIPEIEGDHDEAAEHEEHGDEEAEEPEALPEPETVGAPEAVKPTQKSTGKSSKNKKLKTK